MKRKMLLIFVVLVVGLSCEKAAVVPTDCTAIADAVILSEKEKANTCIYRNVFRYQGALYTTLTCCVCNSVYMAFNCEQEPLCEFDQDCMADFDAEAEYLYAIEGED